MARKKTRKSRDFSKRKNRVPRVHRRVSVNPKPERSTLFGIVEEEIVKSCHGRGGCKQLHPLDNFYFAPKRDRKNRDENDPKSRRSLCIPCYDKRYP